MLRWHTIPGPDHSIVITICVFETRHGDTLMGMMAGLLVLTLPTVPLPVGAVSPLLAELAAGLPACHALCLLFVLRSSIDSVSGTGKF